MKPEQKKAKVSPEDACVLYVRAVTRVRELTREIGTHRCPDEVKNGVAEDGYYTQESCLGEYFHGAEDFRPVRDRLCDECFAAYELVMERKLWRAKVGAAKRRIEHVGKRLIEAQK